MELPFLPTSISLFIGLCGILWLCHVFPAVHGQRTIDGAFSHHDRKSGKWFVHLVSGQDVLVLHKNMPTKRSTSRTKALKIPKKFKLLATTSVHSHQNGGTTVRYDFGQKFYYKSTESRDGSKFEIKKYESTDRFMVNGGPDAVGQRRGKMYAFKGCEYSVRNEATEEWAVAESLPCRLPCNIDAAFRSNGALHLLKGDTYWLWRDDGHIRGPINFRDSFTLPDDWHLKPSYDKKENEPFKGAMNNRRHYRGLHFDAAVSFKSWSTSYIYLFYGLDKLIVSGKNKHLKSSRRTSKIPDNFSLTAAIRFNTRSKRELYYYGHHSMYSIISDRKGRVSEEKKYTEEDGFMFYGGPDAVVDKDEKLYAFKGCVVYEADKATKKWGAAQRIPNGLPFGPDVAFLYDDVIHVVKENKYWIWKDDNTVIGPKNFYRDFRISHTRRW